MQTAFTDKTNREKLANIEIKEYFKCSVSATTSVPKDCGDVEKSLVAAAEDFTYSETSEVKVMLPPDYMRNLSPRKYFSMAPSRTNPKGRIDNPEYYRWGELGVYSDLDPKSAIRDSNIFPLTTDFAGNANCIWLASDFRAYSYYQTDKAGVRLREVRHTLEVDGSSVGGYYCGILPVIKINPPNNP